MLKHAFCSILMKIFEVMQATIPHPFSSEILLILLLLMLCFLPEANIKSFSTSCSNMDSLETHDNSLFIFAFDNNNVHFAIILSYLHVSQEFPHVRYRAAKCTDESDMTKMRDLVPTKLATAIWNCLSKYKSTVPEFPQKETCELLIVDRTIDQVQAR